MVAETGKTQKSGKSGNSIAIYEIQWQFTKHNCNLRNNGKLNTLTKPENTTEICQTERELLIESEYLLLIGQIIIPINYVLIEECGSNSCHGEADSLTPFISNAS